MSSINRHGQFLFHFIEELQKWLSDIFAFWFFARQQIQGLNLLVSLTPTLRGIIALLHTSQDAAVSLVKRWLHSADELILVSHLSHHVHNVDQHCCCFFLGASLQHWYFPLCFLPSFYITLWPCLQVAGDILHHYSPGTAVRCTVLDCDIAKKIIRLSLIGTEWMFVP